MGANDHQLFLSSPDSTYSRSSSISLSSSPSSPTLLKKKQTTQIKSFLISDILKPNFGNNHNQDKSNIPLSSSSPTTTNDSSSSSSNNNAKANLAPGMFPAWVYCTRYSDRPSAGKRRRKLRIKIIDLLVVFFSNFKVLVHENLNHAIQLIQNDLERHLQVINWHV